MRRLILPIVAILMLMPMAIGCVPAEDTAPVPSNPVATQALNVANTNTGSVQALGARMAALESVTAGEVTQAELDALAEQVAVLSAQVTVLETTIPGSTIGPDGTVVEDALAETRWRMRFFPEWDTVFDTSPTPVELDDSDVGIYIFEVVPRTIKEAGIYEITIDIVNENESSLDIDIQNLMLEFRFEPSDDVYVSDMSDVYQVIGPYSVYWNVGIRENTTSGTCRYITADTEQFDLEIGTGEKERIELEFELVYGT